MSDPDAFDRHLIRYGMNFVPRLIARARGTLLWDTDGREILDFTSGQMCATIGHNHPRILEAIARACEGALHLYSGMVGPAVVELARRLAGLLPPELSRSMFLSTGGEANEAALRMAKLHTGGFEVVGLTGSWHGVTAGAAQQLIALSPGAYTLSGIVGNHSPGDGTGVTIAIACAEGAELSRVKLPTAGPTGQRFVASFTVPRLDCEAQWLNIIATSDEPVQAWLDKLRISKV